MVVLDLVMREVRNRLGHRLRESDRALLAGTGEAVWIQ
jgi:hypothetical protein